MANSNKKIIEEMRKYNRELEKHIPGLGETSLNTNSVFKSDDNQDEVFTLFAENLLDLRTEMNLIRKNLSTDIEAMVTRVVNEQQKKFNSRMDNFFVKAILDVKENWSNQINSFSHEVNEIKRSFNQMKLDSGNLDDSMKDLKEQFMLLKSVMSTKDSKEISLVIPQIKSLESKVDNLKSDIEKDLSSELSKVVEKMDEIDDELENNTVIEDKINKLSNSYKILLLKFNDIKVQADNIDTTVLELKTKDKSKSIKKNIQNEFNSKFDNLSDSYDELLLELNSLKDSADKIKNKASPLEDIEKNILDKLELENFDKKTEDVEDADDEVQILERKEDVQSTVEKSPSDKIIDIDSKISKLSSYK